MTVAFILIGSIALCQQPEPRKPHDQHTRGAQDEQPSPPPIESAPPAEPIVPPTNEKGTEKQGEHSERKYPEWLKKLFDDLKITDIVVACFTAVLAFYTALLWKSTEKLWKAGEKALHTTERAFVFIESFKAELMTAADSNVGTENIPDKFRTGAARQLYVTRFACEPIWKNSGSTPTKNMKVSVHWGTFRDGKGPTEYVYPNGKKPFFIGPNAVEPSDTIDMSASPGMLVEWSFRPVPPEPIILVWGRADYEDIFGAPHFVEWCYRLIVSRPHTPGPLNSGFIQWGEYNRTD